MLLEGQLLKALKIAMVAALLVVPVRLHAEDFSGGTERGALEGMDRGGPISAIVDAVVDGVNRVLNPEPRISDLPVHRSVFRNYRHHLYHH